MDAAIARAAAALERGQLVVYPTDTLLGIGAKATNRSAVRRLLAAKGRPSGAPVAVAVSSTEEVESLAVLGPMARAFVRRHLPGPWTLLLSVRPEARRHLAPGVLGPGHRIGIRVPDHPLARELARRVGPLTCTSANFHGQTPARTMAEARREFGRLVAVYVDGVPNPSGRPSSLADLTGDRPMIVHRS
jgi:L-threonylcarbamoyladenylate synthase